MPTIRTAAPLAAVLALAACASGSSDTAPTPAPAPAATPSGGMAAAYTAAQADEGETLFRDFCSGCHSASEFTGQGFTGSWGGRTAYDLHGFISQNMPDDAPGMLAPQEYADIVAYIFELNDMPAGSQRLTPDEARLRSIRIPGQD